MRSKDKKIKYLTNRANNGDFEAQYELGREYASGRTLKQNLVLAEKWFKESAKNGNLYAEAAIGVMHMDMGDYKKAFNILLNVAQKGNMNAQSNLALFYLYGRPSIGISQDYEKAAYWLELAAEQGEIEAMHKFSLLLINGLGIKKDTTRGFEMLEEAASQGYPSAQANLGLEYFYGNNTSKDFEKASEWIFQALANGMQVMAIFLATIYEQGGYGIEQNYALAHSFYMRAYKLPSNISELTLLNTDSNTKIREAVLDKKAIKERMERLQAILSSQQ